MSTKVITPSEKYMTLLLTVDKQSILRTDSYTPVENSRNYVKVKLLFTSDWVKLKKTNVRVAFLTNDNLKYLTLTDEEANSAAATILIPDSFIVSPGFAISLLYEDTEEDVTITTQSVFIKVEKQNKFLEDPNITVYDKIYSGFARIDDLNILDPEDTTFSNYLNIKELILKYAGASQEQIDELVKDGKIKLNVQTGEGIEINKQTGAVSIDTTVVVTKNYLKSGKADLNVASLSVNGNTVHSFTTVDETPSDDEWNEGDFIFELIAEKK